MKTSSSNAQPEPPKGGRGEVYESRPCGPLLSKFFFDFFLVLGQSGVGFRKSLIYNVLVNFSLISRMLFGEFTS